MKKASFFIPLFLFSMHICFGQFVSGQKVLGGTVSLGWGNSKDTSVNHSNSNNFYFSISPSFGKFKNDKKLVEYSIFAGMSNSKYTNRTDTSYNKGFNLGAGYTVTKLYTIVNKVYFTLGCGLDAGYNSTKYKYSSSNYLTKGFTYGLNFGITPGILVPVRNNSMILRTGFSNIASIGYSFSKITTTNFDGIKSSSTGQNASLSFGGATIFSGLYVGLSWLIK